MHKNLDSGIHLPHLNAKDQTHELEGFAKHRRDVLFIVFGNVIQHFCLGVSFFKKHLRSVSYTKSAIKCTLVLPGAQALLFLAAGAGIRRAAWR